MSTLYNPILTGYLPGATASKYTMIDNSISASTINNNSVMTVKPGSVIITGKLVVNDIDLEQVLTDLAQAIGVIPRNAELEKTYAGLRRIAEEYQKELEHIQLLESIRGKNDN